MKNYSLRGLAALTLIIQILMLVACSEEATLQQKNEITGVWVSEIKDESGDQSFLFILNCEAETLSGEVHSYIGNTKMEAMKFGAVEYNPPCISIVTNPQAEIIYEAEIDNESGMMKGRLIYNDGSTRDMDLTYYGREKLKNDYPGIAEYLSGPDYVYNAPMLTENGIKISTFNEEGIEYRLIEEMVAGIYDGQFGVVNSVLILQNDRLLFEKYFGGYHESNMQALHSVTKSIASLCVGLAYDQGKIKSLEESVAGFFPEYADLISEGWDAITIEHMLTMTMGLNWDNGLDDEVHNSSSNIIKDVLSRTIKTSPGEKWEYKNPNVNLTAGIIKHATGMHADELAEEYLFKPLGITEYNWSWDKQNGYPRMDGSLCLRPRDMAKIGLMMINQGKYNGEQIISREWIEESIKFQAGIDDIFSYGYLWWRANSQSDPGTEIIFANGFGGQHIVIVPEYELVIVTTGGNYSHEEMKMIMSMVDEYIIRAFAG